MPSFRQLMSLAKPLRVYQRRAFPEVDNFFAAPSAFFSPEIPRIFREFPIAERNFWQDPLEGKFWQDPESTVKLDKKKFEASLDVQQFKPEEVTVKVSDGNRTVTIEGKHEENQAEQGFISRHFVRRYVIPEGLDMEKVETKMSSDGLLTITAPRINPEPEIEEQSRQIPITQTGKPSKNE